MSDVNLPGQVNLIPAGRLAGKKHKARLRYWGAICGMYALFLVLVALSAYAVWGEADNSIEKERQSVEQSIVQYNSTVAQLRGKLAQAVEEQRLGRAILRQPNWSELLGLIAEGLGTDIVLNHFGLVVLGADGREATGDLQQWLATPAASPLLAEGRYKLRLIGFGHSQNSVAQFILRLEQTGIFGSVRLMNTNRQAFLDDQAVAFSIECNI